MLLYEAARGIGVIRGTGGVDTCMVDTWIGGPVRTDAGGMFVEVETGNTPACCGCWNEVGCSGCPETFTAEDWG